MFSFFVESGQSFLIWAGLEARADNGGNADATNTLTIDLLEEDGTPIDSSLLDIASAGSVSAVPLPAGAWLFLSGLILLASRRRLAVRDTAR